MTNDLDSLALAKEIRDHLGSLRKDIRELLERMEKRSKKLEELESNLKSLHAIIREVGAKK